MTFQTNIKKILGMMAAIVLFVACSDDLSLRQDIESEEDFTGITLLVPNVEAAAEYGATRSDGHANTRAYDLSREGNFNTLYIVAITENGNIHTFFKSQPDGYDEQTEYNIYRVALNPGNYKFYVVANLNRYLYKEDGTDSTFPSEATNEDAIRNMIINFVPQTPLQPGFLPMACLNENIKEGSKDAFPIGDGTIEIVKGSPKKIYVDLTYLCSKVRYTILFDRTEAMKEGWGQNDIIDMPLGTSNTPPYATNLRHRTALNPEKELNDVFTSDEPAGMADGNYSYFVEDNGNPASWDIPLDRYMYSQAGYDFYAADPEEDAEDITKALDELSKNPWSSAANGSWSAGGNLNQRAWQGVAYFPENLVEDKESDKGKLTRLAFPYRFNGDTGVESPRIIDMDFDNKESGYGLKRAKQYDVYVLIQHPDPADMVVNVVIEDWTLQELTYALHGPYELIVDKTSVESLSMSDPVYVWFKTDVLPQDIGFSSPWVSISGDQNNVDSRRDIFIGEIMKNEDGSFLTNEEGYYQMKVTFNNEIPYRILRTLDTSGYEEMGYNIKDIAFFHIIAGNLYKRIDIKKLDLSPYLEVSPQTIIVDTRTLYTSGLDNTVIPIEFETNVDIEDGVILQIEDPDDIIGTGKGDGDLKLSKPSFVTGNVSPYNVTQKTGIINLNIKNIITGNSFWNRNSEFTLKFILTVPRGDSEEPEIIEKTVVIKVRPFTGSYVIHFRDNTKSWQDAHIYVYQDLTLPSDLTEKEPGTAGYDATQLHPYAGRIVGYTEGNPSSGRQWNAAVQYVFSNNCSFRGWKGYGGPDINDPWADCTVIDQTPDENLNTTYGFVMFGNQNGDFWNYSYAYNLTNGIAENQDRKKRYNYEVNFNGDHQEGWDHWGCSSCKWMAPDYNDSNDDHFYTGISMEKEADGWWKYTLSGVAQPGRTMIIFANHHAPWNQDEGDYTAEDNRWPGDYESGLPLFDFEDNEGWFLFDGNTSNGDQKFTDEKPSNVIPHTFTTAYANNLNIEIELANDVYVTGIEVGHQYKYTGDEYGTYNKDSFDKNYYKDKDLQSNEYSNAQGKCTASFANPNAVGFDNVVVIVTFSNGSKKTYYLSPKNFVRNGSAYKLAQPLYTEFNDKIKLFVKWNDHITKDYHPGNGSNYLNVQYGNVTRSYNYTDYGIGKEYGNYKYVIFNSENPSSNKDYVVLSLPSDGNYKKTLKVEDLPKYYSPSEKYYFVNIHKLP